VPSQLEHWMREALHLAERASTEGEVPVGALVVEDNRVVGRGWNQTLTTGDPTAHAEMLAIREAATNIGNYRLTGCSLVVTLEPCPMCAGALIHARIGRLVFGARDLKFGGVRSKFRIADSGLLPHRTEVVEGILAADSVLLLQKFFEQRRGG
jgi:tRNA(adenine34) deaminase